MTTFTERKRLALQRKLDTIAGEWESWAARTQAGSPLQKHHSQVLAIQGLLAEVRAGTVQLFESEIAADTLLDSARAIEGLTLGLRRVWEFFRSKLIQRHDPGVAPFLECADELAWAAYAPMLDVGKTRQEPPLVFLNGGLSPFVMNRDTAFDVDDMSGEPLASRTFRAVLTRMPIPIIGVPWHQVAHLPDLPVLAHETGHAVENDFGLAAPLRAGIAESLDATGGNDRVPAWLAWSSEVFADAWGGLVLGPAYVSSLGDFLAESASVIENEIASANSAYPTATLRILLCVELLERQFPAEAGEYRDRWLAQYPRRQMKSYENDVAAIVAAVRRDIPAKGVVEFTRADWDATASDCGRLAVPRAMPASSTTVTRLVALSRRLFDENPGIFTQSDVADRLTRHARSLVNPGVRSGERVLSASQQQMRRRDVERAGSAAFADLAGSISKP